MAILTNFYGALEFIGGGTGALDKLDGSILNDKDGAVVIKQFEFAPFVLDDDSGVGENSPQIISPNVNPGNKRWILAGGVFANLTAYGVLNIFRGSDTVVAKLFGANDTGVRATILVNDASEFAAFYTWDEDDGGSPALGTTYLGSSDGSQGIVIDPLGKVSIGTITPLCTYGGLDISSGGLGLVIGAERNASTRTNATLKDARIGCLHYTNAEEPVGMIYAVADETTSAINIGGGSTYLNAATSINFYTAADTITPTGTLRMTIKSSGNVNFTGVLQIDDTQVVSNQGVAVADATDPATTMARLNDLLARCRAHGLIAT